MATLTGHTNAAPVAWTRAAAWLLTIGFGGYAIASGLTLAWASWSGIHEVSVGLDFLLYRDRAAAWLAGDGFYLPRQLAGPYPVMHGDATYPPVALLLFAPFTVLPALLWWAVPLTLAGAALWRLRPAWWAVPILVAVLAYSRTWTLVVYGNPSMWALAFLLAGMAWRWPAVLVPLKLTLAPFALVGIHHREWWVGLAVAVAACALFLPMWPDYLAAMRDARQTADYGWGYLLGEWPIAAGLVVVGLSRRWRQQQP